MLASLAGVTASFALGAVSDRPPPWTAREGALDRYFLVQAPAELVLINGPPSSSRDEIEALNSAYNVVAVTPAHRPPPRGWRDPALASALGLDRMWIFELAAARPDLDRIVRRYAAVSGVERVWRDGAVEHCNTPDDTLWGSQWNLQSGKLDCEAVWDTVTSSSVLVSVIDSGADLKHKDLAANLWVNPGETAGNGKDDDGNGYVDDVNGWDFWNGDSSPSDDNGHGSHVAGVVGALGDNSRDVAGICWSATIQAVKVLDSAGGGTWTSIAQGLVYAVDNGATVVNMSLGGSGGDPGLEAAVAYARDLDAVQVAAAGNKASDTPFYPAAYDGVIAVMASDPSDKRPAWSNFGDWCDLLAPGDGVYSLWKSGLTNILSGTSQASPHVAGVAALVRTLNLQLDRIDVELAIETSCDDLGSPGKDDDFRWGRVNAREAVCRAATLLLEKRSIPQGGSTELWISDAAHSGDLYLVNPTLSGREPGYTLDLFLANDVRTVPVNFDWFSQVALSYPDIGVFDDFLGALDATGRAVPVLHLPRGNGLSGATIHFSGFTADPNDLSKARRVMNSVGLRVE
jgi:subtilisin family serine protease